MGADIDVGPGAADHAAAVPASPQIFWVAETIAGKVLGIDNDGIKEFKGVPYGASTEGRGRFAPPRPPTPWTGVREAIGYGPISPQTTADIRADFGQLVMWDRHVGLGGMGEDCLNLNIWTPGLDAARRAVMVSFHGGGWVSGSGNGPMYDGVNLAKFGDVVVVTVNHRLAALGCLHLASLPDAPPELADAGAVSVADMVAALQWVQGNIAAFGGDPGRVMIFGQDGGGSKVSTLLATPSAKGLFHRAAIQSGSTLRQFTPADAAPTTAQLLAALGGGGYAALASAPWTALLQAQTDSLWHGGKFAPVIGGATLPQHPFDPTAPAQSADVPLIISTTLEDAAHKLINFNLDAAGLQQAIAQIAPGQAQAITQMYVDANPGTSPYLIQAQALTDAGARRDAIVQAERRVALGGAPTWMYIWAWAAPAYDGKFGAVEGHDVDASFHIVRSPIAGAGSTPGRLLVDRLASAWVAFAKTGDPNTPAIPHWPAYDVAARATMIFDTATRVENDPRKAFRELWAQGAHNAKAPAPTAAPSPAARPPPPASAG